MLNEINWPHEYLPVQPIILHPTKRSSKESMPLRSLQTSLTRASGHPITTTLLMSNSIIQKARFWHQIHASALRPLASLLKRKSLNLRHRMAAIQDALPGTAGQMVMQSTAWMLPMPGSLKISRKAAYASLLRNPRRASRPRTCMNQNQIR